MNGWIKIHRSILDWEWYGDQNTKVVFLHLLLKANTEQRMWRGVTVQRGQLVTSIYGLSDELTLSVQSVRTAIEHLKTTGEITVTTTRHYSVVTISKYDAYQVVTNEQETKTAKHEPDKEEAEEVLFKRKTAFSPPSVEEVAAYCISRGNGVDPAAFVDFYESKGWMVGANKMKSWQAAVRTWEKRHNGDTNINTNGKRIINCDADGNPIVGDTAEGPRTGRADAGNRTAERAALRAVLEGVLQQSAAVGH